MTDEAVDATDGGDDQEKPLPTVTAHPEGWHLVEAGDWQVSVAPDGLLMLPRHLHPAEVADFCEAALAAADVGHAVVRANDAKTTPTPEVEALGTSLFVARTGESAPGVKMQVTARGGPRHETAIGRPKGSRDPREPRTPAAPQLPGARHGRS